MDQHTQQFFLKIFSVLGMEEQKDALLKFLFAQTLQISIQNSKSKMDESKKNLFELSLKHATTVEAADRIYRQFVSPQEYAQNLFQASQQAFQQVITTRGKPLTQEEKRQITLCIPEEAQAVYQKMNNTYSPHRRASVTTK